MLYTKNHRQVTWCIKTQQFQIQLQQLLKGLHPTITRHSTTRYKSISMNPHIIKNYLSLIFA